MPRPGGSAGVNYCRFGAYAAMLLGLVLDIFLVASRQVRLEKVAKVSCAVNIVSMRAASVG